MIQNGEHRQKKISTNNSLILFILGSGLLLVGIVTAIIIITTNPGENTAPQSNETLSVIPSEVNFRAPGLTLDDLNGNPVSLTDHLGSVVLINNWATWCPPCKAEMPDLQVFFDQHSAQGFILLAVNAGDSKADVSEFVNDYQITFSVLLDPNNEALRAFNNSNLPSSYVIDAEGIVRLAWTGPISLEMLEKYVTPLLEE